MTCASSGWRVVYDQALEVFAPTSFEEWVRAETVAAHLADYGPDAGRFSILGTRHDGDEIRQTRLEGFLVEYRVNWPTAVIVIQRFERLPSGGRGSRRR